MCPWREGVGTEIEVWKKGKEKRKKTTSVGEAREQLEF